VITPAALVVCAVTAVVLIWLSEVVVPGGAVVLAKRDGSGDGFFPSLA
jgi:hypothetical protein